MRTISYFPLGVRPKRALLAAFVMLRLTMHCDAAVQCTVINSPNCGSNHHRQTHKLPTNVGSTYYADGFHGGTMYAKFQSSTAVNGNSRYHDLTYNFNLGSYDGTYWVRLPTAIGGGTECYAVYKNCDVTVDFWDMTEPVPSSYQLT
ncbi:uncharacterized protein N7446_012140 [Penicillium canescens]|uniref:Uncharacterized protein n=1 Tax=Penicillium canescens TaxID=5083 RepID=A0AAD6N6V2_PENCN|nr:uncharacterized protein N7446_014178 [Penicillium canescens]XP_058366248.1 uncharacterized protein N7446_012140 [Penicillium canescens]KAJ6034166.1 hypothetical protein N7460_009983 [Penicillium canescens]KAJ6037861.1 hypothetical protein N7460_007632 [Penicillium canescens]KAJ6038898.1 hypothetical protein N7446_014178 [Penicillium canescens]KAJ6045276.1 hypothetical protein N7446_012140 [Penicillium canescens]KAJ6174313.1 hypothetical protein N7485_005613 [Penicillium canescens]